MKSFHTFFDYWVSTKTSMTKSGRAMYKWPTDDGGIPPTFDSINDQKTMRPKVRKLVKELLGHHEGIDDDLKYLLVANGIRFFNDYLQVLEDEPLGKFKDKGLQHKKTNDLFVNKVRITTERCSIEIFALRNILILKYFDHIIL